MPRELSAYLWDIEQACDDILAFSSGKTYDQFGADRMMQAAIERKFEIIGEALKQMRFHHPKAADGIELFREFMGFRDVLCHQYAYVEPVVVWEGISATIPGLRAQVAAQREQIRLDSERRFQ